VISKRKKKMNKWEYGEVYKKYNMDGEINIGIGIVMVHNIFDETPAFMHDSDVFFCDPPCSIGNINSFYTKADIEEKVSDYNLFTNRLFDVIKEISPRIAFIEVFKNNHETYIERLKTLYGYVSVYQTTYYHNKKNLCSIIVGSNTYFEYPFSLMDEQDCIEWICKNVDYNKICDPCMGRGLIGYYSWINGKRFCGTELNKKRLAVLLERINTGKL
jgi:hypothetical protein